MKIKRFLLHAVELSDFADVHGLTLAIRQRTVPDTPTKFYAYFEDAQTGDRVVLCNEFGNGSTQDEAVRDYAEKIRGKLLVVNATNGKKRREIIVPHLVHTGMVE